MYIAFLLSFHIYGLLALCHSVTLSSLSGCGNKRRRRLSLMIDFSTTTSAPWMFSNKAMCGGGGGWHSFTWLLLQLLHKPHLSSAMSNRGLPRPFLPPSIEAYLSRAGLSGLPIHYSAGQRGEPGEGQLGDWLYGAYLYQQWTNTPCARAHVAYVVSVFIYIT